MCLKLPALSRVILGSFTQPRQTVVPRKSVMQSGWAPPVTLRVCLGEDTADG